MKDSTTSGAIIPSGWGVWLFRAEIEQAGVSDLVLGMQDIKHCVNDYSPTVVC